MTNDVFVASAVRTPIGRFGGAFKALGPSDLAAPVMKAAVERAQFDPSHLDLIMFGHVLRGGHGQLVPRQAAMKAGLPDHVDAVALDMVCSSGMMSVITGCAHIKSNMASVILAGGMESMSSAGFALDARARWGYKYAPGRGPNATDLLFRDGLSDPITGEAMGTQAEKFAAQAGAKRSDLDAIAVRSHRRAHAAAENGRFSAELVAVEVRNGTVDRDEGIRPETSLESLAALRPAFAKDGVLTAGNSSQISDGAASLLLVGQKAVQDYRLAPLARVRGVGIAANEGWRFIEAPIEATQQALNNCDLQISDIDLFENNEAFALSTLVFERQLKVSPERLNVNGGAIALGHPIGCSGARIVVTLLHALKARDVTLGLAVLCHGTGGATAIIVERC